MTQKKFSAQVDAWVMKSQARLDAVFKSSIQEVARLALEPKADGGNMPIDTANLRRSLMASSTEVPKVNPGAKFANNQRQIALAIAGAKPGKTFYLAFQADYAIVQEYGTAYFSGNGFVRKTAQKWPAIVDEQARKVKRKVTGK